MGEVGEGQPAALSKPATEMGGTSCGKTRKAAASARAPGSAAEERRPKVNPYVQKPGWTVVDRQQDYDPRTLQIPVPPYEGAKLMDCHVCGWVGYRAKGYTNCPECRGDALAPYDQGYSQDTSASDSVGDEPTSADEGRLEGDAGAGVRFTVPAEAARGLRAAVVGGCDALRRMAEHRYAAALAALAAVLWFLWTQGGAGLGMLFDLAPTMLASPGPFLPVAAAWLTSRYLRRCGALRRPRGPRRGPLRRVAPHRQRRRLPPRATSADMAFAGATLLFAELGALPALRLTCRALCYAEFGWAWSVW